MPTKVDVERRTDMPTNVDIERIRREAEESYAGGEFFCSEAVIFAIRNALAPEMPEALIAAGSGFPVGVGGSRCMCGAVSGGVICLGYFFGRSQPSNPEDPKSAKTMELAHELQQAFRDAHKGVLCCKVQVKDLDFGSPEHKAQCVALTGEMAAATARIIARELNLPLIEGSQTP